MGRRAAMAGPARQGPRPSDSLTDPQEARAHLERALEEYEQTGQTKGLLLALRDVA